MSNDFNNVYPYDYQQTTAECVKDRAVMARFESAVRQGDVQGGCQGILFSGLRWTSLVVYHCVYYGVL